MELVAAEERHSQEDSPAVFKLSDDVLGLIFVALPNPPITVSHVCHHWRQVTLGFPALWSTLVLNYREYPIPTSVDRFTSLIARSGTHPLTLDFKFSADQVHVQAFRKILKLILPHAERWRHFYFSTNDKESVIHFFRSIQHLSVPLLEHFSVNALPTISASLTRIQASPLEGTAFLGGAPSLTAFRAFGPISDFFQPDLSNITSLYIRGSETLESSAQYYRNILSLPNLECLSLAGDQDEDALAEVHATSTHPITMPRLKHLHLGFWQSTSLPVFFSLVIAPSLKSLLAVDMEIPDEVERFAASSFPSMIQLRFLGCHPSKVDAKPSDYTAFLSLFPNTRHILLVAGDFPAIICPLLLRPSNTGDTGEAESSDANPPVASGAMPPMPNLLTFSCGNGSSWDRKNVETNAGNWRDGLLINPTVEERAQLEVTKNLPEIGWDHEFRFPPDPYYFNERLCIRGDEFVSNDI